MSNKPSKQFSVVVPVFNSATMLPELCKVIHDFFSSSGYSYEMILVNDGSADESWTVLKQLKEIYPSTLIAVNLQKNSGQHKAILCGFRFANADMVVTLDDDLQFLPSDIEVLYRKYKDTEADMVYGIFETKNHSPVRNWGSSILGWIFSKYATTTGQGSSFRLIRASIIKEIKDHHHPYSFIDELICWYASNIQYVTVPHYERRDGKSNYTLPGLVILSLNLIFSYTILPLRFMIWVGLLSFWICLFLVGYFIYQKIMFGSPLGFTALIVSIFMSSGIILFSIGVIGEYINRLFNIQSRKPSFVIKEVV